MILDVGWCHAGSSGGYKGVDGTGKNYSNNVLATGGTQAEGGVFKYNNQLIDGHDGSFGLGSTSRESGNSSGGGGGYYGGASSLRGAGGGSGYIGNNDLLNSYMTCLECDYHLQEKEITLNTTCTSESAISHCAKSQNGFIRITYYGSNYLHDVEDALVEMRLFVGDEKNQVNMSLLSEDITIENSNPSIVSIDDAGKITALSPGKAKIILTGEDLTVAYLIRVGEYQDGDSLYFDVDSGNVCSENDYNSNANNLGNTGCLKFYVFDDVGDYKIKLLLDHNLTTPVKWNSSGSTINGPSSEDEQLLKTLQNDTANWKGTFTPTKYVDINQNYVIDYTGYKARLITHDEVNRQGGFIAKPSSGDNVWLFDHTSLYENYWTASAYTDSIAWAVDIEGTFSNNTATDNVYFGVRPVIEIERP